MPVSEAYEKYLGLIIKRMEMDSTASGNEKREIETEIWKVILYTLRAYHHPNNFTDGAVIEQFPQEMAFAIAEPLSDLVLSKKTPDVFKILTAPGKRSSYPEIKSKQDAVRYLLAVKGKVIKETRKEAINNLCNWYGLNSKRNIERWESEYKPLLRIEDFGKNLKTQERGRLIKLLARKSGQQFQINKKKPD